MASSGLRCIRSRLLHSAALPASRRLRETRGKRSPSLSADGLQGSPYRRLTNSAACGSAAKSRSSMDAHLEEVIAQIHSSPTQAVIYATGGGFQARASPPASLPLVAQFSNILEINMHSRLRRVLDFVLIFRVSIGIACCYTDRPICRSPELSRRCYASAGAVLAADGGRGVPHPAGCPLALRRGRSQSGQPHSDAHCSGCQTRANAVVEPLSHARIFADCSEVLEQ